MATESHIFGGFSVLNNEQLQPEQPDYLDNEEYVLASSWVDSVSYDEELKQLTVYLASGDTYEYYNVPRPIFEGMVDSDSPGRFVNYVLKRGFFPYSAR